DKVDHKNINLDVSFMQGNFASTEMLAIAIWNELYKEVENLGAILHKVRLEESENNFVEYMG
ncbi:MAG TPA: 6-carboxytetrahydropterin synthase, partial [Bacteroidales bacterium]|nr:6-carboxytetrahydropterin synthase [Bacteroidales bacterium]